MNINIRLPQLLPRRTELKRFANCDSLIPLLLLTLLIHFGTAAATTLPKKSQVFDFLKQMLANSALTDMPQASRVNVAVSATMAQAAALGVTISQSELETAAQRPQAFVPASDTTFYWGGAWLTFQRGTFNYTGGKKNTYFVEEFSVDWENHSLTTWSYNGSGTIANFTFQSWDSDVSGWVNAARTTFSYDLSDRMIDMTTQIWSGSVFDNSNRVLYTYDGSSRIATTTTQTWGGAWNDQTRSTYTYDGSGREIQEFIEWKQGASWTINSRWTSTYDGGGRLTERFKEFYNTLWNNDAKVEFVYDGNGDNTLERNYLWLSDDWSLMDVDTMKYDVSHRLIQLVRNEILPFAMVRKTDYAYDGSGNLVEQIDATLSGTWLNTDRQVFVYTTLASKVDETPLPGNFALLQNTPNPFNPTTTIRFSLAKGANVLIEVHNVLGQLVRTLEDSEYGAGIYETTWDGRDVSGLEVASGVYFYTLRSGDFSQTRKMVLMR